MQGEPSFIMLTAGAENTISFFCIYTVCFINAWHCLSSSRASHVVRLPYCGFPRKPIDKYASYKHVQNCLSCPLVFPFLYIHSRRVI